MSESRRLLLLILIMAAVVAVVATTAIYMLYRTGIGEQRARLVEIVQSQSHLIEAVARFDAVRSGDDPEDSIATTLSQLIDARSRYPGFGKTGVFTLARREGDLIVFVGDGLDHPVQVPFDIELAEPMRRALSGLSGTVIGLDYGGQLVLAAYEPIANLGMGIVAKIDLSEVKAPFVKTSVWVGYYGIAFVLLGAAIFHRVANPMIRYLQESEEKYRTITEASIDSIYQLDATGEVVFMNTAGAKMYGYEPGEMVGKDFAELMDDAHLPEAAKLAEEVLSGKIVQGETYVKHKDGHEFLILFSMAPVMENGVVTGFTGTSRDITQNKRAAEALARSGRLLSIRNQIAYAFLTIPDDEIYGEVLKIVLKAMESRYGVFGYMDKSGALVVPTMTRHIWDKCQVPNKEIIFPCDEWGNSTWPRAIREKRTIHSNEPSTDIPEGHIPIQRHISLPILYRGESIGLVQVANRETDYDEGDIQFLEAIGDQLAPILDAKLQGDRHGKERKQAEEALKDAYGRLQETQEQLIRHEKLAALGKLAGGVGHELRNPLGAIKNAAYFLNMVLEEPEPETKEALEILEREVGTSEKIISSLLDFARPKPPTRRKVDVNDVLQETLSRTTVPENIQVVSQLDQAMPGILADPDQLGQVFGNIILNGIQAMLEGGQLVIESGMKNPEWVTVSFTDTGMGISRENLGKLFEALFTTKAKGIGLGLPIANDLVKEHGGAIHVESEVGSGSTFTVGLPTDARAERQHGTENQHSDSG